MDVGSRPSYEAAMQFFFRPLLHAEKVNDEMTPVCDRVRGVYKKKGGGCYSVFKWLLLNRVKIWKMYSGCVCSPQPTSHRHSLTVHNHNSPVVLC